MAFDFVIFVSMLTSQGIGLAHSATLQAACQLPAVLTSFHSDRSASKSSTGARQMSRSAKSSSSLTEVVLP